MRTWAKCRARLLDEQRELEEKEQRRKQRESKKYAKEVQAGRAEGAAEGKEIGDTGSRRVAQDAGQIGTHGDEDKLPLDHRAGRK